MATARRVHGKVLSLRLGRSDRSTTSLKTDADCTSAIHMKECRVLRGGTGIRERQAAEEVLFVPEPEGLVFDWALSQSASEFRRLKDLERENAKLKRMYAGLASENTAI